MISTDSIRKFFAKDSRLIGLLLLLGLLIYLNCLPNEMFWDDDDFILKNAYIKDWAHWPKYFTHNVISGAHLLSNYWRPLLQTVFAIEWHLWADWAPGWHLVSVLVHSLNAALLFILLKLLFANRTLAFLTAAIFLVHPIQTESVVYPNSLGDALANAFVFGGLISYAYFRASGRPAPLSLHWWLALGSYPLALMSKETGILFLAYLVLCDWILQPAEHPLRKKLFAIAKAAWPFLLMAAVYMFLRGTVLNFNNSFNFYNESNALTESFGVRIMTFFRVLSIYAGLLFIPYELRVERLIEPATSLWQWDVLSGGMFFGAILWLAWANRRKQPIITFGMLWFLVGIMPTSNLIVLINALAYEHFLYTSLIGIWLAVWSYILIKTRSWPLKTIVIPIVILFLLFSVRVIWRNTDWRTAIGFYEQLILTSPQSYRVINNLGMEYADRGILDKAEVTYRKAIVIDPDNAVAYHNLANIYRDRSRQGDLSARDEAIALYERTLSLQENFIFSYPSLAQLYVDKGEYALARRVLEKYANLSDDRLTAINNLVKVAILEKNLPAARRYLEARLTLKPGDPETLAQINQIDQVLGRSRPRP